MARRPSNKFVRKAIREIMEPAICELGFEGKYPSFKRVLGAEIHFLDLGTAKYGGSFSYTVGWCANGPLTHWDDEIISAETIEMAHLPFENRASAHQMIDQWTLDGERLRCTSGGFDYAFFVENAELCSQLVKCATETLPQADAWLRTKKTQDAIWGVGATPPTGTSSDVNLQMFINKEELRVRALGLVE